MWKQFVRDYLAFSKKERIGIYTLVFLIVFITILPNFYIYFIHKPDYDPSEFEREISALKISGEDSSEERNYSKFPPRKNYPDNNYPTSTHEDFLFDPNTASASEWKRLGLRDKTIATIRNYLAKGGRFRKPEDIGKIWGLRPDDVARLIPLVRIVQKEETFKNKNPTRQEYKMKDLIVAINSADTNALIALPGIGSKLAKRILNFRDKLGGFVSVDQVGETFGLPDSTFQKIKKNLVADASIRQIDINNCTVEELKAHPYLRYYLANAIIQYRNQHGNYSTVDDIKKILIMTDSIYRKVFPYLRVR